MAQFFNFREDYYGLTEKEIEKNTAMYGLNKYSKRDRLRAAFSPVKTLLQPPVLLMLAAGILCFFGGGIASGIAVLIIDAAFAAGEIYLGMSSDARLADIKSSTAMKYRVIREGKPELIEKEFIVPEDIIVVQEGERVPADAFILEARGLTADESVFTGSNKPAAKYAGAISKSELKPTFVYGGTTILTGIAICRVSATGVDTKLYQKLGEQPDDHGYYTSLEKVSGSISLLSTSVAVATALVALAVDIAAGNGAVSAILRGITLGLCFFPTGFSTVLRGYYTACASDMLKGGAVVKSFVDIERLNSMTVLCVEKEGAISKSSLEVRGMYAKSEELLYKVAALAFDKDTADPAERALMVKASFTDENISEIYEEYKFIERITDGGNAMDGALWDVGGSELYCIKGTPEQILPLCRLSGDKLYKVQKKYKEYYSMGCGVLAFACADAKQGDLDSTAGFSYTFVGLAAFSAPLRESVSAAVKTCRRAGVRVVMMTEDNPSAAEATGKMIGLSGSGAVTGKQISDSVKYGSPLDLGADIFAKVTPEQKLYIIDKMKKNGEVVAMTGTRATDADALGLADIGITISQYASGSCYEAADIIMNDDNFSSIADTIARARQLHRNIKRAAAAMISGYAALIMINIFNVFGGTELMLTPALLALVSMVLIPLSALGYISCRCDMQGSMPRSEYVTSRKINLRFVGETLAVGLLSGVAAALTYMFMYSDSNIPFARSCAFISLGFCTAAFSVLRLIPARLPAALKSCGNPVFISAAIAVVLPILLSYVPGVNYVFGLCGVDILALLICAVTGLFPGALFFVLKRFVRLKFLP